MNQYSDRIHKIRAYFCEDNNKKFANLLGVSEQQASNLVSGFRTPGPKKLEEILTAFPQVNRAWLILGEGAMLSTTEAPSKQPASERALNGSSTGSHQAINIAGDNSGQNSINQGSADNTDRLVAVLMDRINDKDQTILTLNQTIDTLRGEIEQLRNYVSITSSKYINIVERMLNMTTETNELIKEGYNKIGFRLNSEEDNK